MLPQGRNPWPCRTLSGLRRATLLLGLAFLPGAPVAAAVPTDPTERARVVGRPVALQVQPEVVVLTGSRGMQQLVITGRYADGSVRDLTLFAEVKAEAGDLVRIEDHQMVLPQKNGITNLIVKAGQQTVKVGVTVQDLDRPQPISFRHDIIASLNVGGCNSGACHGTPSGKNGFKLSLRGYDPAADYLQLTRDVLGRRTDRLGPEGSLLWNKGLGRIPHEVFTESFRFKRASLHARKD